jgi:acyl-CoA hydrolase
LKTVELQAFRIADYVKHTDRVLVGHSTAEPATLLEAFVMQRAAYSGARLVMHASFSTIVQPEHLSDLRLEGLGAVGTQRRLIGAGGLDVIPAHLLDFARQIKRGDFGVDVALLSVSPPDANGRYSLGLVNDYLWEAVQRARVVIAEMNALMPFTHGGPFLTADDIDVLVPSQRALIEVAPGAASDVERAIAANVAKYIEDGAVIQFGVGAVPDAVAASLGSFRDLGIHSGVIPDALAALIECGAVTNARKTIDTGISVTGAVWGTGNLYAFVHDNPAIHVRPSTYTHAPENLAQLTGFVSLNSAIEIDLSGQANLEMAGARYIGAVGGAVDFVRGAQLAPKGRSIVALPSTAAKGTASRIVMALSGPVTIARSDIDTVVTEYGSAELRGQPLRERARRLTGIAHPDFRDRLEKFAAEAT